MSLCKSLSGRKKDCTVWEFFKYSLSKEKSVCCVVNEKTGENCNAEISGKNPTNLKRHLQAFHKEANESVKTAIILCSEAFLNCIRGTYKCF